MEISLGVVSINANRGCHHADAVYSGKYLVRHSDLMKILVKNDVGLSKLIPHGKEGAGAG